MYNMFDHNYAATNFVHFCSPLNLSCYNFHALEISVLLQENVVWSKVHQAGRKI